MYGQFRICEDVIVNDKGFELISSRTIKKYIGTWHRQEYFIFLPAILLGFGYIYAIYG